MTQEQVEDIRWYIIHAYSGQEDRVKKNLDQRIQTMDVSDKIFQVVVPTEEEMEYKDGQKKSVSRKVFPGYILVQMEILICLIILKEMVLMFFIYGIKRQICQKI